MRIDLLLLGLLAATTLTGCAVVPGQSRVALERRINSRHHAYNPPKMPDLEGSRVLGIPKANPSWWMGNTDEPLPDWWRPDDPLPQRKRSWFARNPAHNFMGYVVGVGDRHRHHYGIQADSIWNQKGKFNAVVTRVGPLLYLPLVSYHDRHVETYLGWRTTGCLGAALRPAERKSESPPPAVEPLPSTPPSLEARRSDGFPPPAAGE